MKLKESQISDLETIKSWLNNRAEAEAWAGPNIHYPIDLKLLPNDIFFETAASYSLFTDKNQLMGFAQIHNRFGCHHIGNVIINPNERHKKMGFKLISALLSIPCKYQKDHSLYVVKHNTPAMVLYQKLGFRTAPWPQNTPREIKNCLFMKKIRQDI